MYFAILRAGLPADLGFSARRRRPPPDPVNALLGSGYTLLAENLVAACEVAGLDPFAGFFHAPHYNRTSLALDLMEEFRSVIVDSVTLSLFNRRMLTAGDFVPAAGGGVRLTPAGLRVFFRRYTSLLHTTAFHPQAGRALSYQKIFEIQARQLRKVIEGEEMSYRPFVTR